MWTPQLLNARWQTLAVRSDILHRHFKLCLNADSVSNVSSDRTHLQREATRQALLCNRLTVKTVQSRVNLCDPWSQTGSWLEGKARRDKGSTHLVGLLLAEHCYFRCNLCNRSMQHMLPLTSVSNCSYISPRLAASPCNSEGDGSAWILLVVALTLKTLPTFRGSANALSWSQASATGHCHEAQKFLTYDKPHHKNKMNSDDKAPRILYLGEIWR